MKKIDWFTVDLEEFQRLYNEAREANIKYVALEAQMEQCMARECDHPPFKKDGTPDKRYDCEPVSWQDLYSEVSNLGNSLIYTYHAPVFEAIGLSLSDEG